MDAKRIKIEVFPDYIETILIALKQKADWHAKQGDIDQGDDAIVVWINQIVLDIEQQCGD
tara:strand:- start:172 stop:351 length:180 start_codon:yes stop_codon:yes gene_type:complete